MISIVTGEKSKISKEKGITLIALVVTIIVLLILAGVSIQMLTGQNGILKRAKEASEKTKKAAVIENVQMEIYDKQIVGDGKITAKELYDILDEYFENVPELEKNGTWKGYPNNFKEPLVSKEDNKIEVEIGEIYKGTIETTIKAEEVVEDLKEYIGAYVNYGVELDNDPSTPDWRIFYAQNVEGKSRVYLIAADYVPTDNEALVDAMGGGESKAMLRPATGSYKDLCVNWSGNFLSDLQPIRLENWKGIFKDGDYILTDLYQNSKCVTRLRETTNWAKFTKGIGGEYAIGGPTAQMWCAAWNTIIPVEGKVEGEDTYKQITANAIDTYGYNYTSEITTNHIIFVNGMKTGLNNRSKLEIDDTYSLFFPHTEYQNITANGKTGDCCGYWLSSPSAMVNTDWPAWYLMAAAYDGSANRCNFGHVVGVRPVVSLTSNISLTESGKTEKGKPVYNI